MKETLIKLISNLGVNAVHVLGWKGYALYFIIFILSLPKILTTRTLNSVDKIMSKKLRIHYKGYDFIIDCDYTDNIIKEDSYTFGLVRELYIRDCYFKHHKLNFEELKYVVDLGSNRGTFSLLAANFAEKVVSVETQSKYNSVVAHNMEINGFDNYFVENVFIGSGNAKSFDKIMEDNGIDGIDFLKIDIEGAEFGLFKDLNCLDKIRYISMEVHQGHGNVHGLIEKLEDNGFDVILCNERLERTENIECIAFLYAKNMNYAIRVFN